jgi:DNA-directed RNA polymerase subunit RPC12/RpoP
MTIRFACPKCGRAIRTSDDAAGKSGKCNDCGTVLTVPRSALTATVPRSEDEILAPWRDTPPPPSRRR